MKLSLKKYKYLMKTDKDVILQLDENYIIRDVFFLFDELLLMPRDAFVNQRLDDILPVEILDQLSVTRENLAVAAQGQAVSFFYDLNISGQMKHFNSLLFKDIDDDGCNIIIALITEDFCINTVDLFELNLDLMLIVDYNGRIIRVNSLWEKVMGYSTQDLLSVPFFDMVHPCDRDNTKNAFQHLLKTGNIRGFINRYRTKNGQWRWLEWNASVKDNLLYGISRDISDQIKLEDLLKSGEINFRNFFDTLDDMVLIATLEGQIIFANSALFNCLGYSPRDLSGKHVLELHPPALRMEAEAVFQDMLAGSRTACTLPAQSKDGQIIPAETKVWFGSWNGSPCIFALIKDMTRQIESEKIVKKLNAIQDVLMDLATQFINLPLSEVDSGIKTSLSMMGEFVAADRVYIFDYDFVRKTSSNTFEWCAEGIESQIDQLQDIPLDMIDVWLGNHLQGLAIQIERIEDYHDDDKTKEILQEQGIKSLLAMPMMKYNECLGFVGFDSVKDYKKYSMDEIKLLKLYTQMLVNIRSRESQETRLKNSLEEKTLLMKEIHHRVKNNLQIVSSLLFLQSHSVNDSETRKALSDSENRIRAMALLHENIYQTNELIDFSFRKYIESIAQQVIAHYQPIRVVELVCDLADIRLEPDRAILCGLILNELLINAMQHAFEGCNQGKIKVRLFDDSGQIILIVADDGIGLSLDIKSAKKTSIGIQLIDSLVKQLKGTIQFESSPGQGMIAVITFASQRSEQNAQRR